MPAKGLRLLPAAVGICVATASFLTACREEDPVRTIANPGATPTMVTTDVDTYVSDSGYIKYHAVTDVWEMYDDTTEPYWRFPEPLIIDILAPGMKPDSHIECDSAIYLTQRRLFRFDGHVIAVNISKDTFLTQQLFWDQTKTEFYTDSFIHIVRSDRILEGYGFVSNEKMTRYTILNPTAILPASELQKDNGDDRHTRQVRDSIDREEHDFYDDPLMRPEPVPASQRNRERQRNNPDIEITSAPSTLSPANRNTDPSFKRGNGSGSSPTTTPDTKRP